MAGDDRDPEVRYVPGGDVSIAYHAVGEGPIEAFLGRPRRAVEQDRVLATVMFTDIAGSTERIAAIGDRARRELLGAFQSAVRRELERVRGREIGTAGDDFLAIFDGPARAVRCALASEAAPGEVLVSSTVKDLVAGSGLVFVDRELHEPKGVPEPRRLFAVADEREA